MQGSPLRGELFHVYNDTCHLGGRGSGVDSAKGLTLCSESFAATVLRRTQRFDGQMFRHGSMVRHGRRF